MKICAESDLVGTVEIKFRASLPEGWPHPVWHGLGFVLPSNNSGYFLDLSEMPLEQILKGLCPEPKFTDLREAAAFLSELQERLKENLPPLHDIFDLPQEEFIQKLLPWIIKAPVEFWKWCDERSMRWGQLRALALLNPDIEREWLRDLARWGASSQEGQKILEWCVELELMGMPLGQLGARTQEDLKSWLERLRGLRFPISDRLEKEGASRVEQLVWPKGVQAKWARQGDRQVLEIRLTASSKQEYSRQLERLLKDERSPWT
jgi:hypothetical protein